MGGGGGGGEGRGGGGRGQNTVHSLIEARGFYWRPAFSLHVKGGAYPTLARLLWKVISLQQLFAAETCNKFLKIEHHDSIVYRKNERILTFFSQSEQ